MAAVQAGKHHGGQADNWQLTEMSCILNKNIHLGLRQQVVKYAYKQITQSCAKQ